jgi:class 3 adenylate cyclase
MAHWPTCCRRSLRSGWPTRCGGPPTRRSGATAIAALALHDAVRLGAAAKVHDRLVELTSTMQGDLFPLFARHAHAAVGQHGDDLLAVATAFESLGFLLYATEAAAQAASALQATHGQSSPAASRALTETTRLAARCQRLRTPALTRLPASDDLLPLSGDHDTALAGTHEFLTGTPPDAEPDRFVTTVLFTDIVDSTGLASRLGDRRWQRLLDEHNAVVRAQLARFRGREDNTTGDGFLASFDTPALAIRAADAIRSGLAEHGIQIRVGIHTGECELHGGRLGGIAVHIAARVLAHARPGKILCSRTVKDLAAGTGFRFTDRGLHLLKGVPDKWQLYEIELVG